LSNAKKEREDKQYYVNEGVDPGATKNDTNQMIKDAEKFVLDIKVHINKLNISDIDEIRKEYNSL